MHNPAGSDHAPRRYLGYLADSARWQAVALRSDDIIISTPAKCGTTWTQNIVGMLVFATAQLPAPLSELSPWVEMQIRTTDELAAMVDPQRHRRFLKSHTPLDGLPEHPTVTYLTVFRHPLDVALSDLDHSHNIDDEIHRLRWEAVGDKDLDHLEPRPPRPEDPGDHLRQFIDGPLTTTGSGPYSLADLCDQLRIAWERSHQPNVHLFHYDDLRRDLDGEMRRIAAAIDVDPDHLPWRELVEAATFDAMQARAGELAPDATRGIWQSETAFFRQGGRRGWQDLLTPEEVAAFESRLDELAGPAANWLRNGRSALDSGT